MTCSSLLDSLFGLTDPGVRMAQPFIYISILVPTPSDLDTLMTDGNTNVSLTFTPASGWDIHVVHANFGKFPVPEIVFSVMSDAAQS